MAPTATVHMAVTEVDGQPAQLVWDTPPDLDPPVPRRVAAALGLRPHRELLQLRRSLPIPVDEPARAHAPHLQLRRFDPDRDAQAWVSANNAAFATHPSQGDQTLETLAATLAEPWVDLDGFLVLDDPDHPGELVGSCWTRVHEPTGADPELGEIFVIGVHPRHHGHGTGAALVLAGLDHLAAQGVATGMLWVEADNAAALRLYDRLGFEPERRRRIHA